VSVATISPHRHEVLSAAGRRGGKAHKHRWTDDEMEIVRQKYQGTNASAEAIARELGVTKYAVKGIVQRLGITRVKSPPWTADEDERLIELLSKHPAGEVAKRMGRSTNAVVVRSKRLGYSRRSRDGWYTKKDMCCMLGVNHRWLQRYIDRGELKASWHYGTKPGQKGFAAWHIEQREVRKFIIRHCYDLVGRNVDLPDIVYVLTGGRI